MNEAVPGHYARRRGSSQGGKISLGIVNPRIGVAGMSDELRHGIYSPHRAPGIQALEERRPVSRAAAQVNEGAGNLRGPLGKEITIRGGGGLNVAHGLDIFLGSARVCRHGRGGVGGITYPG